MGSCLGSHSNDHHHKQADPNQELYDIAMTDPDLGWRRLARHQHNANTYPSAWEINGVRPSDGVQFTTDMITLTICAAFYAHQIWAKYTVLEQTDTNIDFSSRACHARDIHKHFGLRRLEWTLHQRCRPFRCAEINPNGIQGAATLAKIEVVDNRGAVDVCDRRSPIFDNVKDFFTQGSSWKEGDRIQVMERRNIDKNNMNPRRKFIIDSGEIALNIVDFEKRITKNFEGNMTDFINCGVQGWVVNQCEVLRTREAKHYVETRNPERINPHSVMVLGPHRQLFEFVPEELLLSVTSRLQEAFMTQSAF